MLLPSQVVAELCLQQLDFKHCIYFQKKVPPTNSWPFFFKRLLLAKHFFAKHPFLLFLHRGIRFLKFSWRHNSVKSQQIRRPGGFCEWQKPGVSRYFNEITSNKNIYHLKCVLKNNEKNSLRFSFLEYVWCICVVSHVRFWSCLGGWAYSKAQNLQEKNMFSQGFLVANHQHELPCLSIDWRFPPRKNNNRIATIGMILSRISRIKVCFQIDL